MIAFSGIVQGASIMTASGGNALSLKIIAFSSIGVSLVLVLGILTPIIGSIATLCYLVEAVELLACTNTGMHASALTALELTVMSLTLVLLAPGAYSLNARMFGRREIIIPDGPRSRR